VRLSMTNLNVKSFSFHRNTVKANGVEVRSSITMRQCLWQTTQSFKKLADRVMAPYDNLFELALRSPEVQQIKNVNPSRGRIMRISFVPPANATPIQINYRRRRHHAICQLLKLCVVCHKHCLIVMLLRTDTVRLHVFDGKLKLFHVQVLSLIIARNIHLFF